MYKNGIVYIAFNMNKKADHSKEVIHSVKSIKKIHPKLNVTLFTDEKSEISEKYFDNIKILPINDTREKQNLLFEHTPYTNTLYLDSDTELINPITESFLLMERFDIAACIDHCRIDMNRVRLWDQYGMIPDGFSEFAGGVIMFRKTKTVEKFFKLWQKNYKRWCEVSGKVNDQPSFRVSLWECEDLKLHTLPPEFNIRTQEKRDKFTDRIKPRIYHWHDMSSNIKRNPQRI